MEHALELPRRVKIVLFAVTTTPPFKLAVRRSRSYGGRVVFLACPSKAMRSLCESIKPYLGGAWQLKLCLIMCKGLELETLKHPLRSRKKPCPASHVAYCRVLPMRVEGKPTAVVLAVGGDCEDPERYQSASNSGLRVYLSDDLRGTELGGTLRTFTLSARVFAMD